MNFNGLPFCVVSGSVECQRMAARPFTLHVSAVEKKTNKTKQNKKRNNRYFIITNVFFFEKRNEQTILSTNRIMYTLV